MLFTKTEVFWITQSKVGSSRFSVIRLLSFSLIICLNSLWIFLFFFSKTTSLFTVESLNMKSWVLNLWASKVSWSNGAAARSAANQGSSPVYLPEEHHPEQGKPIVAEMEGLLQSPSGLHLPSLWDHRRHLGFIVGACENILNLSHHQQSLSDFSKYHVLPI